MDNDFVSFYNWLYSQLQDDNFDLSTPITPNGNSYELINILCEATHSEYTLAIVWECAYMYLQRLRREHIVVFSAVRQDFDQDLISDILTGRDHDGFTVMIPTYYGKYDEWRHRRHAKD